MLAIETYTAPSYWASYLINGDSSALTKDECEAADNWLRWVGRGDPVSCSDAGFKRHHDARQFCDYACDCQTYTFLCKNLTTIET